MDCLQYNGLALARRAAASYGSGCWGATRGKPALALSRQQRRVMRFSAYGLNTRRGVLSHIAEYHKGEHVELQICSAPPQTSHRSW